MFSVPFTARSLVTTAGFISLLVASAALSASAQESASSTAADAPALNAASGQASAAAASANPRLEYALYIGEGLGGRRTFATGTSTVSGKHWHQFAERLKTPRFPEYPSTEPAFFNWLSERGWELVGCQRNEEIVGLLGDRDIVTRCYFRRTASTPSEVTPADSLRGSASEGRTPN